MLDIAVIMLGFKKWRGLNWYLWYESMRIAIHTTVLSFGIAKHISGNDNTAH